ncbi:hypothetical protein UA08_00792 [Talaromyces atroroseus]|uniref:Uncharacterized protein n=1 Tax=Talaromyces atroroseus TaxID=1441469 RepID=A0A225B983_TALAT|nr:hypothetical protein UA08_00792 [Talaromyces atroroseus]OKL64649.1 hypothetical protein UA08_00792 [Talaromyces atroroseus]
MIGFLDLPEEIRNMIYMCLIGMVYSEIDFSFHGYEYTATFLDQIGQNAKHIRRIFPELPTVLENKDGLFKSEENARILDKIQSACTGSTKLII